MKTVSGCKPGSRGRKGQFLITQLTSDYLGLQFAYLLPMQGSLTRLDPLQSSLLVATVVLIALLLLCLYLIKRYYFKPLNTLSDAIAKVRSGDLEAKMEPDIRIDELRQVALALHE
jgi:two-component system sensor histidine kinase YesM